MSTSCVWGASSFYASIVQPGHHRDLRVWRFTFTPPAGAHTQTVPSATWGWESDSSLHTNTNSHTHRELYLTIGLRSIDREPYNLYDTSTTMGADWRETYVILVYKWQRKASLLAASANWRTDLFLFFHPSAPLILHLSISHSGLMDSHALVVPLCHSIIHSVLLPYSPGFLSWISAVLFSKKSAFDWAAFQWLYTTRRNSRCVIKTLRHCSPLASMTVEQGRC